MNENQQSLARMLRQLGDLAEDASLTGSLKGGAPQAARRYNHCLRQLQSDDAVPQGMFEEIEESTADFGRLGVDARLLASFIDTEREESTEPSVVVRLAPFLDQQDLADLVRQQMSSGLRFDTNSISHVAPFLPSNLLGQLVQEAMRPPTPPQAPAPPPVPVPHQPHVPPQPPMKTSRDALIERLSQPGLSTEERIAIAHEIAGTG